MVACRLQSCNLVYNRCNPDLVITCGIWSLAAPLPSWSLMTSESESGNFKRNMVIRLPYDARLASLVGSACLRWNLFFAAESSFMFFFSTSNYVKYDLLPLPVLTVAPVSCGDIATTTLPCAAISSVADVFLVYSLYNLLVSRPCGSIVSIGLAGCRLCCHQKLVKE